MNVRRKWGGGGSGNTTHLLLDGGTLSVPPDQIEEFYREYLKDISSGLGCCIVEKKTEPRFRFFIDFDCVVLGEEDVPNLVGIAETLYSLCDACLSSPCFVARAGTRDVEKGGKKYGMHLIWSDTSVSRQQAMGIRASILDQLEGDEWAKFIDASVYAGSGLRMLWSFKAPSSGTSTPYVPWGIIRPSTMRFEEFKDRTPSIEFLRKFSIRIENQEEASIGETLDGFSCGAKSELEAFIRKNIPGQERLRITKITPWKRSKTDWCVSTDSKFCENVGRDHKGNHVCFRLTPLGVLSQRCNDDACKGFKSKREYRIPSRLLPEEAVNGRVLAGSHIRTIYDYLPDGWRGSESDNN